MGFTAPSRSGGMATLHPAPAGWLLLIDLLPRLDTGALGPGVPLRGEVLHLLRQRRGLVLRFDPVSRQVVQLQRLAVLGDELPVADADGLVAFVLPVQAVALDRLVGEGG